MRPRWSNIILVFFVAHWIAFRSAFYRLTATVLGEAAIPCDLGALRLAFRDHLPSLGPQEFFPFIKNGLTTAAADESELENMDIDMVSGITMKNIIFFIFLDIISL